MLLVKRRVACEANEHLQQTCSTDSARVSERVFSRMSTLFSSSHRWHWRNLLFLVFVLLDDILADKTCPAKFGYFPDPNDCQGYYICTFGNAKTRKCGGGLHYKTTTQTCDTPKTDNCVQDGDQASRPKYSGPMMKNNDNAPAPAPPSAAPASNDQNGPSQSSVPQQYPTNQANVPFQDQQHDISAAPAPQDAYAPPDSPARPSQATTKDQDFTGLTQQATRPKNDYVPAPPAATTASSMYRGQRPTFGPVKKSTLAFHDRDYASKMQPTLKPAASDKSTISVKTQAVPSPGRDGYSDAVKAAYANKPSFGKKKTTPAPPPPPPIETASPPEQQSTGQDNYNGDSGQNNYDNNQQSPSGNYNNQGTPDAPPPPSRSRQETGTQRNRKPPQNNNVDSQDQDQNPRRGPTQNSKEDKRAQDQSFITQNNADQNTWQQNQDNPRNTAQDQRLRNQDNPGDSTDAAPPVRDQDPPRPKKHRPQQNSDRENWQNQLNSADNDGLIKAASQNDLPPPEQKARSRPSANNVPQKPSMPKARPPPKTPRPTPPPPPVDTSQCSADACQAPDCQCGTMSVPGGMAVADAPQMVLISFDAEINERNLPIYEQVFHKARKNPNGCNIKATFFVSHEFTNYGMVRYLYEKGHEIGSHSITHGVGTGFKDEKSWETEMTGEKGFLASFASIRPDDIKGARAPLLGGGGDDQFQALQNGGFLYDSTLATPTTAKAPYWPYTLDYGVPHACGQPPCPQGTYKGFWELPLNPIYGLFGENCYEADRCTFGSTGDEVYKLLYNNFYDRYYSINKAPFQLAIHADWLKYPPHREAFERFLDLVASMPDVWVVTGKQAVSWMQSPTPLSQLANFPAWQCSADDASRLPQCDTINACPLPFRDRLRYFYTCSECPAEFPWRPDN